MFSVIKRGEIFFFHLKTVSNVLSFACLAYKGLSLFKAQNNGQQVAGHDDRPNIF